MPLGPPAPKRGLLLSRRLLRPLYCSHSPFPYMGTARVAGTAWGTGRALCASTPSPGTASEGVRRQALQFPGSDPSNNRMKGPEDTQGHCQGLEPQKVVFSLGRKKKTDCRHKLYFLEKECVFPTCLFIYKSGSTKFHCCGCTSPTLVPRLCVRMTLGNCCVLPVWGTSAGCRKKWCWLPETGLLASLGVAFPVLAHPTLGCAMGVICSLVLRFWFWFSHQLELHQYRSLPLAL